MLNSQFNNCCRNIFFNAVQFPCPPACLFQKFKQQRMLMWLDGKQPMTPFYPLLRCENFFGFQEKKGIQAASGNHRISRRKLYLLPSLPYRSYVFQLLPGKISVWILSGYFWVKDGTANRAASTAAGILPLFIFFFSFVLKWFFPETEPVTAAVMLMKFTSLCVKKACIR